MTVLESVFDTTTNSWAEAERLHPGCSPAWDRDGGPAWANGYPNLTICISTKTLAVGCNDRIPFRWALWLDADERWFFTSPPALDLMAIPVSRLRQRLAPDDPDDTVPQLRLEP